MKNHYSFAIVVFVAWSFLGGGVLSLAQDTPPLFPDVETARILFQEDFETNRLSSRDWSYNPTQAELIVEQENINNTVFLIGYETDWAEASITQGGGWTNYQLEVDVRVTQAASDNDSLFIGVRYQSGDGDYNLSLNPFTNFAYMNKQVEDIWYGNLSALPFPVNVGQWYRVTIRVEENVILAFINGRPVGRLEDEDHLMGTVRFFVPPDALAEIDNVIVRELASRPRPDELLITEIMVQDGTTQWFEIYNDSPYHVMLDGVTISNGRQDHIIDNDNLIILPEEYMVLAQKVDEVNGLRSEDVNYVYGEDLTFPVEAGVVSLEVNDNVVAGIAYNEENGWPLQNEGLSLAIHPDFMTNRSQNQGYRWCLSVAKMSDNSNLRGTPGRENNICVREEPLAEISSVQTGDLIITEVMANPRGPDEGREWFEIYNTTDEPVSLRGFSIATDKPGEVQTFTEDYVIPAKSYAVLAQTGLADNGLPDDITVFYYRGGFKLSNTTGEISILDGNRVLDTVSYRENIWWPNRAGLSTSLHTDAMSAYSNDDLLNWCLGWSSISTNASQRGTPGTANDSCPMWELNSPLIEDESIYDLDQISPVTMRVEMNPVDLELLTSNPFSNDLYPAQFTADDYEYDGTVPNANIRVRGGDGARTASILSFRIGLLDVPYREQNVLALNKHMGDPSRLRNALSFKLFEDVPDFTSMRTQFVHLYINGEDFGLYTMVENPGDRFLRNHRLDDRGHLLQVQISAGAPSLFSYYDYDGFYADSSRPETLSEVVDLEAGTNYVGLAEMLDAVYSEEDIQTVIDEHFNRENLMTYFATVYLVQNMDTTVQNYMLYSTPREPSRFYFLPWDYDNAFYIQENSAVFPGKWRRGFGNWIGIRLFERMMRDPELVDELILKILELAQTSFSVDKVNALIDQLHTEVEPFAIRRPDNDTMDVVSLQDAVAEIKMVIPNTTTTLAEVVEWPLPPLTIGVDYLPDNALRFEWLEAIDLQNDPVNYEVVLFDNRIWDENHIVFRSRQTNENTLTLSPNDIPVSLPPGNYYWMVYAWDSQGNYQTSPTSIFGLIDRTVEIP